MGHHHETPVDGCYWCALRDGNQVRTPAQAHVTAPQDDEPTTTDAPPNRLPSGAPVDSPTACQGCGQTGWHACDAEHRRLRNLAQSHAHEAHRIADNSRDAGLIHAHLAIAYALLAQEQQ